MDSRENVVSLQKVKSSGSTNNARESRTVTIAHVAHNQKLKRNVKLETSGERNTKGTNEGFQDSSFTQSSKGNDRWEMS